MQRVLIATILVLGALASSTAPAQSRRGCRLDLQNHFGPFDYRTTDDATKSLVENAHFTYEVEALIRGQSGTIGGDISYTLRVFPNHARALMAMAKLARREKTPVPAGALYSVECWFERAILFKPDDPVVRMVYGIELLRDGRQKEAIEQLKLAEAGAGQDPNIAYNLGLAYFDLGDFEKSLTYARRAYELGFPLPGLRDKLRRAGKWRD